MGVPTRILAIDDHALFRESLVHLLECETDFHVVAQCNSVAEALPILSRSPVDLVLLDYEPRHGIGTDLLHDLRSQGEDVKVLVVTGGITDAVTLEVLAAGAAGVLYKQSNPSRLLEAIRRISQGEIWLDHEALRAVIAGATDKGKRAPRYDGLTLREQQVLSGVLAGLSNREIAEKLKLSTSMIKTIIQELFGKAEVRTRSQLVRVTLEKHVSDWLPQSTP
jgi:two-component system, NarL family, nitrate/nitrite response regulator NarL